MKTLIKSAAAVAMIALVACVPAEDDEGITQEDLLNDFPQTPADVAATLWKMNCDQLESVELLLSQIETFGPLARPIIVAAPLPDDDKEAILGLIDADSKQRRDAELFVDAVQLVKFCG